MNYIYAGVNMVYLFCLVAWIAGDFVIGAIALPEVFGNLARPEAGKVAARILAKFKGVKLVLMGLVWATSAVKIWNWEQWTPFIRARYGALILLSLTLVISAFWLSPKMQAMRPVIVHLAEDHPDRIEFGRLHKHSVTLGKAGLLLGLIALYLS